MRTLHFEDVVTQLTDSIVPAHGHKFFRGHPCLVLQLNRARVVGRCATGHPGPCPLKVMAVLIPTMDIRIDEPFKAMPIIDGALDVNVGPCAPFMVRVDNPSDSPWNARVVVIGTNTLERPGLSWAEEYAMAMEPISLSAGTRRFRVPAHDTLERTLQPPFDCSPRRFTMRSDAAFDLDVESIQVCSINLIEGPLAVEFFAGGLDLRTVNVRLANRMSITLHNKGDCDRYVEIDVEVDPPHER
jgi:hypothetical protein